MAAPSTEERELDLVEKVDFRILNVANNEKKFQEVLGRYLAPLLLKASSPHASVRHKVLTIAERLQTLIKPEGIILPVAALVGQFKSTDSEILRILDMKFILHSIGRMPAKERREVIPSILRGISRASMDDTSTDRLVNLIFRVLPDIKVPPAGTEAAARFPEDVGLSDAADTRALAEWFGRLLLLTFRNRPMPLGGGFLPQPGAVADREEAVVGEGLSPREVELLTLRGDVKTWDPRFPQGLSLLETRLKVLALLSSTAFSDEDRFMPALYAAGHPDKRISGLGDDLLKKSTVSLEDGARIQRLFDAHGDLSASYRTRILTLLSKSSVSVTFSDEIVRAVDKDIHADVQSLELKRLHGALLEYISWVARIGPTEECGVALMAHLRAYIADQGWPVPNASQDELLGTLRSRAYESIGMLAGGTVMDDSDRLELARWLFQSLAKDPVQQVVVSVDGALSSLASRLKPPLNLDVEEQLKTLLLVYMTLATDDSEDAPRNVRHAATKWANTCLPFSNPTARWIDILAVAGRQDERSDVVEEGKKGLDPWTYLADAPTTTGLPDWQTLVQFFFEEKIPQANVPAFREMDVDRAPTMVNFPESGFLALPLAINFCLRMLFLRALPEFTLNRGWERELEAAVHSNKSSKDAIRRYVARHGGTAVSTLLLASFEGAKLRQLPAAEESLRAFVSLAAVCPRSAVSALARRARELLPLTRSNRKETRSLAAKALGILGGHPKSSTEDIEYLKVSLFTTARTWKTAVGAEMNAAEGAFLALGYLLSRLVYYSPQRASEFTGDIVELIPESREIAEAPSSFQSVVYEAVAQLWTAGIPALPLSSDKGEAIVAALDVLTTHAKKSSELAVAAMGRMSIALDLAQDGADRTKPLPDMVLDKLYGLHELKQAEAQFAVGEAIAAVVACWDSDSLQLSLDVESEDRSYQKGRRSELTTQVLAKILADCKTTKPALLKASGIWLFCLVQHCSHLPEIQSKLRESQDAFMRLLSARDELVQETASRGLSLVYEKGDESLKGALVRDLVAAFTGSGPQLKVDEETELFDAGALPTGEGKSITSYKDIVNLANEVGDQSLVYKFMSLATNAATWSTRSAFGRFGLSNILSESEIDPKLYPKLYRYRFDPNPNVRKSMNDIWSAIVKDPNAVMEAHFDAIMEDLMKNILGREWRVREASCAAVSDLVQGRPFPQYEKYYGEIWVHAAKVLDDIKGSVREAAFKLCMTLSKTLVRQLEEGSKGAAASAMMKQALNFLLSERGIESSVEDVKIFSTITVLDIAKHGGKALRPVIPTMIPQLLGLLSTIEGSVVNYAYQRASEQGREKIDKARSSAVSRSPITEAIENLLRNVDGNVMTDLTPGLEAAVKSALALPTKIGCSRVLSTLATRHAADFGPHSARFLDLMLKQVLDKNDEASTGYARAAAYIVRVAPDQARTKFVTKLVDIYFAAEDETRRQKVGDVNLALAQLSPDHFNALEGYLLPFAYLGMHDTDDYVRKEFTEIWNKHAGSTLSILRYVPEIVGLVERALDIQQWALKHTGALASAAMAKAVANASAVSGGVGSSSHGASLKMIWPSLEQALLLKTFPGKEALLEALPDVGRQSPASLWQSDPVVGARIKTIAIREAKRNNDAYRVHAFRCLWRLAAVRDDIDMLDDIAKVVTPFLDTLVDEDRMDVDEAKSGKEDTAAKTGEVALEAVARGYSRAGLKKDPAAVMVRILDVLRPYLASPRLGVIRRTVWYKCVADLVPAAPGAAAGKAGEATPAELALGYFDSLDLDKAEVGTEEQRSTRAKAAKAVAQGLKAGAFGTAKENGNKEAVARMKAATEKALAVERSLDVQKLLRTAAAEMGT